jgi:hypothetical protein
METEPVCETSVDLNCIKQPADHEVFLNFVATKASGHNNNNVCTLAAKFTVSFSKRTLLHGVSK